MRRTPFLLALTIAGGIMLALSGSALAAGGQSKSGTHGSATQAARTSPSAGGGSNERDVPGAAVDPSAKSAHDHDNGIGNDCDPGYGGSVTEHGNDAGHGTSPASETEVPNCRSTSTGAGGVGGAGGGVSGTGTGSGTGSGNGNGTGIGGGGGGGEGGTSTTGGAVSGTGTGMGGAEANAATGGVLAASTGVGGAVSAATGAALANTGARSIVLGLIALLLILAGIFLMVRRPRRAHNL